MRCVPWLSSFILLQPSSLSSSSLLRLSQPKAVVGGTGVFSQFCFSLLGRCPVRFIMVMLWSTIFSTSIFLPFIIVPTAPFTCRSEESWILLFPWCSSLFALLKNTEWTGAQWGILTRLRMSQICLTLVVRYGFRKMTNDNNNNKSNATLS